MTAPGTSGEPPPPPAPEIDHERLLAEIDEEARRRRESGELPADFERELDLVFARFAPFPAIGNDFAQLIERAEQSTFVDVRAPTQSAYPGVPQVKRVVHKAISWELNHLAHQFSTSAAAVVRAMRLLGERVDRLERAVQSDGGPAAGLGDTLDVGHWAPVVTAALAGTSGRVLHTEAGDGSLVGRLLEVGLDAYGADPVSRSAPAGTELRHDDTLAHLKALPEQALAAAVLSGCVDRGPLGDQRELARLASTRVAADGVIIVLGTDPRAWAAGAASPVAADLAPGRPFHAETWAELLRRSPSGGTRAVEVVAGPRPAGLRAVPGAPPDMASNLHRLDQLLFPPASYAVIARPAS